MGGTVKGSKRSSKAGKRRQSQTNYESAPSDRSTEASLDHSPGQEEAIEAQFGYDILDDWPVEPLFTNNSFKYSTTTEDSSSYFGSLCSPVDESPFASVGSDYSINPEYLWKIL